MVAQSGLSYATLNALAILHSPELQINNTSAYDFYETFFGNLCASKDTWKQSVRHNFCTTKYFVKISDGLYMLTQDPIYVAKFKKAVQKRCTPENLAISRQEMSQPQYLESFLQRFHEWADATLSYAQSNPFPTPPSDPESGGRNFAVNKRNRKRKGGEMSEQEQGILRSLNVPVKRRSEDQMYAAPKNYNSSFDASHESPESYAYGTPQTLQTQYQEQYRSPASSQAQAQIHQTPKATQILRMQDGRRIAVYRNPPAQLQESQIQVTQTQQQVFATPENSPQHSMTSQRTLTPKMKAESSAETQSDPEYTENVFQSDLPGYYGGLQPINLEHMPHISPDCYVFHIPDFQMQFPCQEWRQAYNTIHNF